MQVYCSVHARDIGAQSGCGLKWFKISHPRAFLYLITLQVFFASTAPKSLLSLPESHLMRSYDSQKVFQHEDFHPRYEINTHLWFATISSLIGSRFAKEARSLCPHKATSYRKGGHGACIHAGLLGYRK